MPAFTTWNPGQLGFTQQPDPRQQLSANMTDQQQKKPWWTSLISEGGGMGGAATGAAIGTALLPGIGTIAGGALGAFLGGTGGRLVENKVRDNKFNVGSALGEGATDAAFSGFSALNDVRKGAKAVKALSSVTKGIDNPQALLQAPDKVGLIQGVGKSLKAGASGYGIGSGSKASQLDAASSDAVANTLKTLKIPATAPETQARMLGGHLDNLGKVLTTHYNNANVPIASADMNQLGSTILGDVAKTGGLGNDAHNFAMQEVQKLVKAKDPNEVWQYVKDLARNKTNFTANGDAKLADQEAAARIILDKTRGFLNGKVPGAAETNNLYHQASNAQGYILDAAKDKGGGLANRALSLAPVKAAEAKLGAGLESVGKYTAGTGQGILSKPASLLTHQAVLQGPADLIRGAMNPTQVDPNAQPGTDPQSLFATGQTGQGSDVTNSLLGQTNGGGQGSDVMAQLLGQPQQQSQAGMTLDSLKQALQQDYIDTGGKNSGALMQIAQLSGLVDQQGNPVDPSKSGAPNVGKISAQQYGLAQSGRQSLQQLSQLLESDPSLATRNATSGQGIPLIGNAISNIAGVSNYHSLADNILSSLIHLQTGATATKEEITAAKGQLPGPTDDPVTRQRKLNTLMSNFAPFLGSN